MDDLDKLIRDTDIERVSDNFTSGVMDKIRSMPAPNASSPAQIDIWFKIMMVAVFAGAFIFALFSTKDAAAASRGLSEGIYRVTEYLSGLFSILMSWSHTYTWLIFPFLFSLAGMLYLISQGQDIYHQYG